MGGWEDGEMGRWGEVFKCLKPLRLEVWGYKNKAHLRGLNFGECL